MNTPETKIIVDKFLQKIQEIENISCFASQKKYKLNDYKEIFVTSTGSLFIDKNIDNKQILIEELTKIKNEFMEQRLGNEPAFPNIYYCKNREEMEKIRQVKTNKPTDLENVFIVQEPKYTLNRVILNTTVKEDILTSLTLITNQHTIYETWGFSEIDSTPKLILNFYGVPGTGKTMVSHAVANELGKKILCVNYAEIESKYVGEAPKNLFNAFEAAKNSDAVLFFDEADSFLGKRIENVSSSSDQAINSLRSQMLILLEEFNGVVIFATNLVKNYDKAFESRILKHIKFELPDFENRKKIIEITIPPKAPFDTSFSKQNLIESLATISEGFAGREIKNAILESLTIAVQKNVDKIDELSFIDGFNKIKDKIQNLENEREGSKITPKFNNKLQTMVQEHLDTGNVNIMDIGIQ